MSPTGLARLLFRLALYSALICPIAQAQQLTTLHSFDNIDGYIPNELVQAADNNFYGTTIAGGRATAGTFFKITPSGTFTTLYDGFSNHNGAAPNGLLLANDGNFYGTDQAGGPNSCGAFGCGTIFQVTPMGIYTTLYSFNGGSDGYLPYGGLTQATDGYLYGTTAAGGSHNTGTVFKISTDGSSYRVLFSFGSGPSDGFSPVGALVQGRDGNLYGMTQNGGGSGNCRFGCGTIFKITTTGSITPLHNFAGSDGSYPTASMVLGNDGNFYGTTTGSGTLGPGTVFKITPSGTFTNLYTFCKAQNCTDGFRPEAGLFQATDGNFYGTTAGGGSNGQGTTFRITPAGALTTLHSFTGADGASPYAAVVLGNDNRFYGTTAVGGGNGDGTIFRLDVFPILSVSKVGSGTVTSIDGHIYCGDACSFSYINGTQVTLSAIPAPGFTFGTWTGCDNVNGSFCFLTINSGKNVTATFTSVGNISLTSLTFKPTFVRGGQLSAGTLTLNAPAPPGGLAVALSSDHPGVAHPPAFVFVPANQMSVQFAVKTFPVKSNTTVSITATAGASHVSGTLTVGTTFNMPVLK